MNKIDITSTAVEKGIDAAKEFLDKLVGPSVEEVGMLLKDKVAFWRYKNQVKMINKAQEYCLKNKIKPKQLPLKILAPMLEYSSLEEDEFLQDKWSILLTNLVDSNQNIQNHVFPYILSQISRDEFNVLEKVYRDKLIRIENLNSELESFLDNKDKILNELNNKIKEKQSEIDKQINEGENKYSTKIWDLQREKREIEYKVSSVNYTESRIKRRIALPASVYSENLQEFEISNLTRLGLIRYQVETIANTQTLEIPNDKDEDYLNVDVDIELETDEDLIVTELGELFVNACQIKNAASNNR